MDVITLRQLQYFIAVAEEEHFTRASERLLIAQPSVSRQVKDLEGVLGVELFVRDTRGVHLTEAGRQLLVRARTILAMVEGTVDAVRSAALGEQRLRLGYYGPAFYNNPITRSALERFRAEAPDVEVVSYDLFSEQTLRAVREGRIDVGVTGGETPDLESHLICVEPLVVLVPETDDLARKPHVCLADLDGRNVIAFPRALVLGLLQQIERIARDANITLNTVREGTQFTTIAYYVSQGEGIALQTKSSLFFPFPGVVFREISDPRATVNVMAFIRRGEQSPIVLRFLELLTSAQKI